VISVVSDSEVLSYGGDSDDYTLLSAGVEGNEPQPAAFNKFTKPLSTKPLTVRALSTRPLSVEPLSSSLQWTEACDRSGSVSYEITTTYITTIENNCVYGGGYAHGTFHIAFDKAFSSAEELLDALDLDDDELLDRAGGYKVSENKSASGSIGSDRVKSYYHIERKSDRDIMGDINEIIYFKRAGDNFYFAISNATITLKNNGTKDTSGRFGANFYGPFVPSNNIVVDVATTGLTGTGSSCYSGGTATITGSSGVIEITYGATTITVKLDGVQKFSGYCSQYWYWLGI
jgi:hypothetical protein